MEKLSPCGGSGEALLEHDRSACSHASCFLSRHVWSVPFLATLLVLRLCFLVCSLLQRQAVSYHAEAFNYFLIYPLLNARAEDWPADAVPGGPESNLSGAFSSWISVPWLGQSLPLASLDSFLGNMYYNIVRCANLYIYIYQLLLLLGNAIFYN